MFYRKKKKISDIGQQNIDWTLAPFSQILLRNFSY